jgi:hypothetical protein
MYEMAAHRPAFKAFVSSCQLMFLNHYNHLRNSNFLPEVIYFLSIRTSFVTSRACMQKVPTDCAVVG